MNNHYAKFEFKGMKTVGVLDYTNQTPPTLSGWKKYLSSTLVKNEKIFRKFKVANKGPFVSMDRQTDGQSGPTTRPAFAKATQAKSGILLIKLMKTVSKRFYIMFPKEQC